MRQASALTGSQETQGEPLVPQASRLGGVTQVLPVQHPSEQLISSQPEQAPLSQAFPDGQDEHSAPAEPQTSFVVPERQSSPSQQPEQETESQTHDPSTQC
jgi:hypothetical protein